MPVTVDDAAIDRLLAKFDSMAQGLEELQLTMPAELTDWQRDDLRRVRTFTDTPAHLVATTKVWRRWRKRAWRVGRRPGQRGRRRGQPRSSASVISRAILSPKSRDDLHKRMTDLVTRSLTRI
jgi:hypothetical protein